MEERGDEDVCPYMYVNHVDGRNSGDLHYEKNTTRRQYISYMGCICVYCNYMFSNLLRILGANSFKRELDTSHRLLCIASFNALRSSTSSSGK